MKHLEYIAGLISASGIAVQGNDLFIGTLPADVRAGVMLRDPLNGIVLDDGMKNFYSAEIQVIVRDPDGQAGYQRALSLLNVLRVSGDEDAYVFVSWILPCSLPITYPRGNAGDLETSFKVHMGFGMK